MDKSIIKNNGFRKFKQRIIKDIKPRTRSGVSKSKDSREWRNNPKLKKYQLKDQENADIWSISESFNNFIPNIDLTSELEKPNLRQDIFKEMLGFKLKRLNKAGVRTPKELWQRVKYLSKGLTLEEWSDRVEGSWENMLEYSEKLWENFFIYSFKKYKWYPYAQKYWSDSWYGQNWRNWRREEDSVTWQINSRTPWHKHIRLSNDASALINKREPLRGAKKDYTFPQDAETIIGANRLKLNNQIFTNTSRHEIIKQGSYNTEQPESSELNVWNDSANIYLKYIRPWLMRLNFLDKPSFGNYGVKYLGKEQHRKNYQVVPQKNIFQNEIYQIAYNLKLIKLLSAYNQRETLEKKFGKRNVKMYFQNKDKLQALLQYEKLLNFRQTNQNLTPSGKVHAATNVLLPKYLNKNILNIFFIILYSIQ